MEKYLEYMVKRPITTKDKMIRFIFILLIAVSAAGWFLFASIRLLSYAFFLLALALGVMYFYFVIPGTDIEYEYLYLDREITVDKIMGKEKRKTLGVYEVDRIELMCPVDSERGAYKNGGLLKYYDYSSGVPSEEHKPYAIFYEGNVKIVLDLPVDFVKMVQTNAPRKVFMD